MHTHSYKHKRNYELNNGKIAPVTPAEKILLSYCEKVLPKDVVQALFDLGDVNKIIAHLKNCAEDHRPPHLTLGGELKRKYAHSTVIDTISLHQFLMSLRELVDEVDREKNFEENKIEIYKKSASTYKERLESEIRKEVRKIKDDDIKNLYGNLKQTVSNTPSELPEKISDARNNISSILINQYRLGTTEKQNDTEKQLVHYPKLIDTLKKLTVMEEASKELQQPEHTKDQLENNFLKHLKNNKPILTKRRDSEFDSFLKGLGVVAASILGIGFGGYYAHKYLFGSKATEGSKHISEMFRTSKSHYRKP